jgi:hypothetical protein
VRCTYADGLCIGVVGGLMCTTVCLARTLAWVPRPVVRVGGALACVCCVYQGHPCVYVGPRVAYCRGFAGLAPVVAMFKRWFVYFRRFSAISLAHAQQQLGVVYGGTANLLLCLCRLYAVGLPCHARVRELQGVLVQALEHTPCVSCHNDKTSLVHCCVGMLMDVSVSSLFEAVQYVC